MNLHANAADPTRTKTLRRSYAQRLRGQLSKLNTAIRRGVRDRDIFGINQDPIDPEPPAVFRFTSDSRKVDQFLEWLEQQEERGLLRTIERNENQYIRTAYQRGLGHAETELRRAGVDLPGADVQEVFNRPVHRDNAQMLYTRNFQELRGITETMNQQISRELTDGFTRGEGADQIARRITDRVDNVGKHRATVMARTEVINAHSEATLSRFEEAGVRTVTVKAEFETAGDDRVCSICASLEGAVMSTQEVRQDTFRYDASDFEPPSLSGTYGRKPPIHAQCRCVLLPVVEN